MSVKKSSRAKSESTGRRSPLREKRKKAAQFLLGLIVTIVVIIVGLLFYGLWQSAVRVEKIETPNIAGNDQIELLTRHKLQGTYFFLIPKDSIFFFPELSIEKDILSLRPDFASVSVRRSGFNSLRITVVPRVTAYVWCGTERVDGNETGCYDADWAGFIFLPTAENEITQNTTLVRVYAPLSTASSTEGYPLRSTVAAGASMPEIFSFVKEIKSLGVAIAGIRLQNDEVTLYTNSGTYLTYVAHREKEALSLLSAALPSLSLTDGSVEYLDLRFDGKVYIKRKGEAVE